MLQKFILHLLHEKLIFCIWFFIWIIFNLLFLNIFNTILIIIIIIINTNFKLWFIAHLYTFFFQRCLVFLQGLFLFIFSNWFLLRSILLEVIPVINILWFYTIFIICLIIIFIIFLLFFPSSFHQGLWKHCWLAQKFLWYKWESIIITKYEQYRTCTYL